ncbi:MAG: hypothetical protein CMC04_04565 [Flavobacteriaceae bacterium]|nr:hypothetical protein [Flavobacteriaceae bacterium]|tara:strand:+ start:4249 stop:4605 length:357 start_codon:yes stop_codon:yes gene_type:complete
MNKMQEISNKFFEGEYIKPMSHSHILSSKKELYDLLKTWKIISNASTIGNLVLFPNNKKIILLSIRDNYYYLNADSTREGVVEFLTHKTNPWKIVKKSKVVTNHIDSQTIKGFYMYKK